MAARIHPDLVSNIELASAIDAPAMLRKHANDSSAAWRRRLREDSHRVAVASGNLIRPSSPRGI